MFWIIIIAVASSAAYEVNKCCADDELYFIVENTATCKSLDNSSDIHNSTYYWLPENFNETKVENLNGTIFENLVVNYNTTPHCKYNYEWFKNFFLAFNDSFLFLNTDEKTYENGSFCLERMNYYDKEYIVAQVCKCSEDVCISKCCGNGKYLNETNHCVDSSNETDWILNKPDDVKLEKYKTVYWFPDCDKWDKIAKYENKYILNNDGSISPNVETVIYPYEYCIDYKLYENGSRLETMIACYEKTEISLESKIYGAFSFIAAFFFLMTAIILCWIPELGGTPKYALVIQVVCLLVAHLCLGYAQVSPSLFGKSFCIVSAFVLQFSFVAAFFWLNVMCIDLSRTFSSVKALSFKKYTEMKNFWRYSIYAWSGSFLITLVTIIFEYTPIVDDFSTLKPNFGENYCWFTTRTTIWIFFFGPIGILLLINTASFFYTSFKIIQLKRETKALQYDDNKKRNNQKNEKRFSLYLKMFMLMGIPWITEIISWAHNNETSNWRYLWYITDSINIMRAVFIFVIFCCKEKVWVEAKKVAPCLGRCEEFVITTFHRKRSFDGNMEEFGTVSTSPGTSESAAIDSSYVGFESSDDRHRVKDT